MYDKQTSSKYPELEAQITFGVAYRYTNFSLNIFYMKPKNPTEEERLQPDHEVKIFRFWAYDPKNNVPCETVYFLKMVQIVNFNNPAFTKLPIQNTKFAQLNLRDGRYPRDSHANISNYLLHSK